MSYFTLTLGDTDAESRRSISSQHDLLKMQLTASRASSRFDVKKTRLNTSASRNPEREASLILGAQDTIKRILLPSSS
jgi:hypothetical protein